MAIKWENNVLGFVPKTDWLSIPFDPRRQNDPIDTLFGDEQTQNLVAEYESIAAEYQIPVMAQFHGFDTQSQTTFRVPIDTHNIEKGLIKVKIDQSERLRALIGRGVQGDQQLYDYVIKDGVRLADQVFTRTKVAKNELMATGKVTIKENNLDLTVDYGVSGTQTGHSIDLSAGTDVPAQIQAIIDAALDKGVTLTGILTSRKVLSQMRSHASIQQAINGNVAVGATVRESALREYLSEEFGITQVITNDLRYGASATIGANGRPTVTQKRYFPENKISFFSTNPGGRMGTGLWGAPPEADVTSFLNVNTESSVSPYVYVSQWTEKDPATLWTKASALFIPVLYSPDSLYIATVTFPSASAEG